jgi:peptidyl-prolyl cis-trans isomerase B (cyclophilin B)
VSAYRVYQHERAIKDDAGNSPSLRDIFVGTLFFHGVAVFAIFSFRTGRPKHETSTTEHERPNMAANRRAEVDEAIADVDFDANNYQIEFDTTAGKMLLDLYPDVAPGHCRSVIGLTRIGFYNGIIFHRVIKDFVIQVGCPNGTGTGGPGYTIDAEFSDRLHEAGVLSMARTSDPNSAGSQFFVCMGRVPHLDRQYTVFGKTADEDSLKNALSVGNSATDASDRPVEEVKITTSQVIVTPK